MVDPKKVNMNNLPKKLCDGAIGSYGKEIFAFALTTGTAVDAYGATPQTMKSIAQWMTKQVEQYEKQFGEIDMKPSPVHSPIQMADLNRDRGEGNK